MALDRLGVGGTGIIPLKVHGQKKYLNPFYPFFDLKALMLKTILLSY